LSPFLPPAAPRCLCLCVWKTTSANFLPLFFRFVQEHILLYDFSLELFFLSFTLCFVPHSYVLHPCPHSPQGFLTSFFYTFLFSHTSVEKHRHFPPFRFLTRQCNPYVITSHAWLFAFRKYLSYPLLFFFMLSPQSHKIVFWSGDFSLHILQCPFASITCFPECSLGDRIFFHSTLMSIFFFFFSEPLVFFFFVVVPMPI